MTLQTQGVMLLSFFTVTKSTHFCFAKNIVQKDKVMFEITLLKLFINEMEIIDQTDEKHITEEKKKKGKESGFWIGK